MALPMSAKMALYVFDGQEILERHGHLFQLDWIPVGRDAAVYWDPQDFCSRNSTDTPIRIDAYLSVGRVYVELLSTSDDGI